MDMDEFDLTHKRSAWLKKFNEVILQLCSIQIVNPLYRKRNICILFLKILLLMTKFYGSLKTSSLHFTFALLKKIKTLEHKLQVR